MDIGSLCKHDVVTIDQSATLQDAARLMREHHVGALVVMSPLPNGFNVTGIVTDRDLVVEAMAQGADARATAVGGYVDGRAIAVPDTTGLSEATAAMRRAGVRRLLVTTPQQRLAGIVSIDDLLATCAAELQALSDAVHHGIERETEVRRPISDAAGTPVEFSIGTPSLHWTPAL